VHLVNTTASEEVPSGNSSCAIDDGVLRWSSAAQLAVSALHDQSRIDCHSETLADVDGDTVDGRRQVPLDDQSRIDCHYGQVAGQVVVDVDQLRRSFAFSQPASCMLSISTTSALPPASSGAVPLGWLAHGCNPASSSRSMHCMGSHESHLSERKHTNELLNFF